MEPQAPPCEAFLSYHRCDRDAVEPLTRTLDRQSRGEWRMFIGESEALRATCPNWHTESIPGP